MSKQMPASTRRQIKNEKRREEQRRREEEQRRAARTKRSLVIAAITVPILVVVIAVSVYFSHLPATPQAPINPAFPAVDNITCDQLEQSTVHYHVHLSMYINGAPMALPAQLGIAPDGSCFYWLHTHDTKGVIHIESPADRKFTLRNFLDIWSKQFPQLQYPLLLDGTDGWQVYVDGQPYKGDFHTIPLASHILITLAYHSPKAVPDTNFDWAGNKLPQ